MSPPKRISLALQGGGSHGAFQWGVLDRLLEEERLEVEAITSASAGAFNAVAFASGLLHAGREGAKRELESFWRAVNQAGGRNVFGDDQIWNALSPPWLKETPLYQWWETAAMTVSPYDNPFSHNPLANILRTRVDFEALRARSTVKLRVSATSVRTGEARVFAEGELTTDVILASACLPQLFQAVTINGEPYWDGGYVANPALWPLFCEGPEDLLIVHINPLTRTQTPRRSAEIMDRLNEISFNASLTAELRAIAFVNRLLDEDQLTPEARARYRRILVHAIKADHWLDDLSLASKFDTEWSFLQDLRGRGRRAAERWLQTCLDAVGDRSTVDIKRDFLSETARPETRPAG